MVSRSSRREKPDEHRDVIVHPMQVLDPTTGGKRNTWMVWLGPEKQTECTTVEEATELARRLARKHSRRAWLHDATGYPLRPIEL